MKSILRISSLMALALATSHATETVIVDWNQSWDYFHPMGLDPAIADTDFNATWFLNAPDFAATYNGPAFGGVKMVGNSGDTSSADSGSGAGPLGYGATDYFTSAGALITALGTSLTTPATGSRYAAYFRTTFTLTQTYTSPRIRMLLDDGALVYLDGVLVARVNKSDNTEAYTAFATDTTASLYEVGASTNNENCIQSFPLGRAGAGTQADSFVVVPVSSLAAGDHTLAISVRNNAASSSDLCMAFQMLADNAGISTNVTNVQRQENGPGFADDTFSFDVMVVAFNLPGAISWTSSNPPANGPAAGFYGNTYSYTYPAQPDIGTLGSATITFTDENDPLLTTSLTVSAPPAPAGTPLVISPATPSHGTGFEEISLGTGNFSRRVFHSEIGVTSTGAAVDDRLANGTGSKMLRFAGTAASLTTEAIGVDPAVKGIQATVKLRTYTDTTTGFEFDDSLRIAVESSVDGTVWVDRGSLVPALYGNDPASPLNPAGYDQLLSKLGPGVAGLPALRSRLGWSAKGYDTGSPNNDTLTLPAFVVPDAQPVQLEFRHRYSFEYDGTTRWDGGAVAVAINGGPFNVIPGTAFTRGGYIGLITGNNALTNQEAFNGDSPGYARGEMITSILTIPGLATNDSVQVQFLGGWDEFATGSNPNWEINRIVISSGADPVYTEEFTAGNGGLTGTTGWVFDDGTANAGPAYHTFVRSAVPLGAGDQFVRLRLYQPAGVVLSTSEFILIDDIRLEMGLDPLTDADSDGVSNGMEDFAGTGISDPLSAWRSTAEVIPNPDSPGSQRATLSFAPADFRAYRFQSSNDLVTWTDLETRFGDAVTPQISFSGQGTGGAKFWRIAIIY